MNIETLLNIIKYYNLYIWLVVLTILKNMSSSMGRMTSQYIMENKSYVPNHQPVTNSMTRDHPEIDEKPKSP